MSPAPPNAAVPLWLRKVVVRGLATDPEARYPSMDALLEALAADPAVQRRRLATFAAIGAGVVAVGALAVLAFSRASHSAAPSPCQVSSAELAGAWDADVRAAIETAFTGTKRVHAAPTFARVSKLLDARAAAWLDMRRDACLATRVRGAQSEHLLDLRAQCLERRKEELSALTALFARGSDPDVLNRAISAINALTPVTVCADTEALAAIVPLPDEPAARERVLALGRKLDEVEALARTGQWKLAVEPATAAATEARAIGHAPTLARALLALGRTQDKAGKPQEAEATLHEALDAAASARDHVTIARAWIDLMEVVGNVQQRFDDALAMQQSADLAVKVTADPLIAAELERTLGRVLLKKGDFEAARVHAQAAVDGFERAAGKDAAPVAASLQGLAIIMDRLGKFDEAKADYERALAIFKKELGDDHPSVGGVLNDLGALMSHRDRHLEARPYYEQAVVVLERALGPEHPHVATVSYNLGILTRDLGDNEAALAHFKKAEEVYAKALGPDHPDVASAISSQATTLRILGRYDEARTMFDRALVMTEKAVGPDHIETAVVLESIALLEQDVGDYAAARARYDRVLAIEEKAYGKDNPEVSDTLLNLGNLEAVRGRYADARRILERALALAVKGHGETSVPVATVLHGLADLDRQQGRHASAVERYTRVREIFERELGADHPNLGVTLSGLGQSQLALGNVADAVTTLRRAVAVAEKTPSDVTTLPLARLALGRALYESGARADGRALVVDAAAALSKLGPGTKSAHATAEAWLKTKPL